MYSIQLVKTMLSAIGQQFRQPTGLLGRVISLLMKKGNMPAYEVLIEQMNIQQGDQVFEIGYGPGKGIEAIQEAVNCTIEGIDFSPLMHKEANARNKNLVQAGKLDLYLGDFLRYELMKNTYDKIFCINVVYFWDDLIPPFRKIQQGLKNGGEFHFYMSSPEMLNKLKFTKDHIFCKRTLDEVLQKAKDAGFSKITHDSSNGCFVKCTK